MQQHIIDNKRKSFSNFVEFLRNSVVETEKQKLEDAFNAHKHNFEKKNVVHQVEICEEISLDSPKYQEELDSAKIKLRERMENSDEYIAFSISKFYLSVCSGEDEFPDELYLNLDCTVTREETNSEFRKRVLQKSGLNPGFKTSEELPKYLTIERDKRNLKITFNDEVFEFDIKIQKLDELEKKTTTSQIFNYLQKKGKQIKFK